MPAETSKNVSENVATRVFAQQLAQEREHVAKIYARLDDLREETSQKLADVRKNQAVGGHQTVPNGTLLPPITKIAWPSLTQWMRGLFLAVLTLQKTEPMRFGISAV